MNLILKYFLKQLVGVASGDYAYSLFCTLKVSLFVSPLAFVCDRLFAWGLTNQDYIWLVLGAIFTDYIFGTIKHIWFSKDKFGRPRFTLKGNAIGLVLKLTLVVAGGFLFEALSHLTREASFVETSLQIITRVIVFMYPAVSAWENIYIVSGEKFPPKKWMERLGIYKNSSNIKDLFEDSNLKG